MWGMCNFFPCFVFCFYYFHVELWCKIPVQLIFFTKIPLLQDAWFRLCIIWVEKKNKKNNLICHGQDECTELMWDGWAYTPNSPVTLLPLTHTLASRPTVSPSMLASAVHGAESYTLSLLYNFLLPVLSFLHAWTCNPFGMCAWRHMSQRVKSCVTIHPPLPSPHRPQIAPPWGLTSQQICDRHSSSSSLPCI